MPLLLGLVAPREVSRWVGSPKWYYLFLVVGFAATFTAKFLSASKARTPYFTENPMLRHRASKLSPAVSEESAGFRHQAMKAASEIALLRSDIVDNSMMANPDWDCRLCLLEGTSHYKNLIDEIRKRAPDFRHHVLRLLPRKILDGKALINEHKIALTSAFPPPNGSIDIYRSDYFAALCTVELSLRDIVHREEGKEFPDHPAETRALMVQDGKLWRLREFSDTNPAASLHFGIIILAVSSDNILRLPKQSKGTMIASNKRIPLATGSVDWADISKDRSLKKTLLKAAKRELDEEWGGHQGEVPIRSMQTIGYFRDAMRGGKPEFVVLTKLACRDADLVADTSEVIATTAMGRNLSPKGHSAIFTVGSAADLAKVAAAVVNSRAASGDSVALFGAMLSAASVCKHSPDVVEGILSAAQN